MPEQHKGVFIMPSGEYAERFLGVNLEQVDPETDQIIGFEEERQARKLIMIPSESMAPRAVRQALGSVFNNVYAENTSTLSKR
jgi:glycine/serine hydroxymethyltransferase